MLVAGDEAGRTQGGNNNAYCQDNEISWLDWRFDEGRTRLLEFAKRVIALRQEHPVFRRTRFLTGERERTALPDAYWFRPDGLKMTRKNWEQAATPCLGLFLNGEELRARTAHGEPLVDDSFLILFNAHHEPCEFTLPPKRFGRAWELKLSTADPDASPDRLEARAELTVESRSVVLLQRA